MKRYYSPPVPARFRRISPCARAASTSGSNASTSSAPSSKPAPVTRPSTRWVTFRLCSLTRGHPHRGPAIVQYLADRVPEKRLAPPAGTLQRYRLMEWLNFISTELHKGFGALFNPALLQDAKAIIRARLAERLAHVARRLGAAPV